MSANTTRQKQNYRQRTVSSREYLPTYGWMAKTLEEVDHFKYLGSTLTKDGTSQKEIKIGLAQAHSAITKTSKTMAKRFPTKIKLLSHYMSCQYCALRM